MKEVNYFLFYIYKVINMHSVPITKLETAVLISKRLGLSDVNKRAWQVS